MKIVGYLPDYRISVTDTSIGRYLDDLIYFSLRVDSSGNLDRTAISETGISKVMSIKERYGVPVRIGIAGWWTTNGTAFAPVMTNDSLRAVLLQNLVDFCLEYGFDGVDYDWEYPQNEAERLAYADMFEESRIAFDPYGWKISVAVNSKIFYEQRAYDAVDQIHIMSYGNYADAVASAEIYMSMGIDKHKIFMGTPFFGRGAEDYYTYRQIVDLFHPGPEINAVDGYTYQGPWVQERRVQYAHANALGGIMIWEVGQDATGDASLLKTIYEAIDKVGSMPAPARISAVPTGIPGEVRIQFEAVPGAESYRIYSGASHHNLNDSVNITTLSYDLQTGNEDGIWFVQIVALDSNDHKGIPSKYMAASTYTRGKKALIVNAYDDWRNPVHLIQHHSNLFWMHGFEVSSVYGDLFQDSTFTKTKYQIIDWVAGDKGHYAPVATETALEHLGNHIDAGGNLIISGSNVGYDLYFNGSTIDKTFFIKYLSAIWKEDAPGGEFSTHYEIEPERGSLFDGFGNVYFDDGSQGTYNVFNPDVIYTRGSGRIGFNFTDLEGNTRAACIYAREFMGGSDSAGHVAYFTIPLETIYPERSREDIFNRTIEYFNDAVTIDVQPDIPESVAIVKNYPNPFNPVTTIRYSVGAYGHTPQRVDLTIHNVMGQKIATLVSEPRAVGEHRVPWDASGYASGVYYYRLLVESPGGASKSHLGKMILIK